MKSLADELPPEIASRIHPDWRKNETDYWAARATLLPRYRDLWIAFADGVVVASGASAVDVLHAGLDTGKHPYVSCVGREEEPCRMRRSTFTYDSSYPGASLPVITLEIRTVSGIPGMLLDHVIPDTGADASALPWSDCQAMQLDPSQGLPTKMGGMTGSPAATIVFRVWTWLDGQEYPCRLQVDFSGNERILGRDVLNRLEVLFRGPHGEVVINP
jgi:hypothetical protein